DSNACKQCDHNTSIPTSTATACNDTEPQHDDGEEEARDNTQHTPVVIKHFQDQDNQRDQARDAAKICEGHLRLLRLLVSCNRQAEHRLPAYFLAAMSICLSVVRLTGN